MWRACSIREKHSQLQKSSNGHEKEQAACSNQTCAEPDEETELVRFEGWLWNLENWEAWKAALTVVGGRLDDPRVHEVVCREASEALKCMEEVQTVGEYD